MRLVVRFRGEFTPGGRSSGDAADMKRLAVEIRWRVTAGSSLVNQAQVLATVEVLREGADPRCQGIQEFANVLFVTRRRTIAELRDRRLTLVLTRFGRG